MIVYSRFNCRQHCLERNPSKLVHEKDVLRAIRRMNSLRFEERWLRERLDLFRTYTVPSMESQTNQKFRWIGIAHPDSPGWFIDELRQTHRMDLKLHEWDVDVDKEVGHTTVNLDTDDALSRNFIANARNVNFIGETLFLRGMRFRPYTNCWISTQTLNSHFNIVQHPEWSVLDFSHGMGNLKKHIIHIKQPMWLEVIHERNIANTLRTARKDRDLGAEEAKKYFDLHYERIHDRVIEVNYIATRPGENK